MSARMKRKNAEDEIKKIRSPFSVALLRPHAYFKLIFIQKYVGCGDSDN
jgi:hypothetical protein